MFWDRDSPHFALTGDPQETNDDTAFSLSFSLCSRFASLDQQDIITRAICQIENAMVVDWWLVPVQHVFETEVSASVLEQDDGQRQRQNKAVTLWGVVQRQLSEPSDQVVDEGGGEGDKATRI